MLQVQVTSLLSSLPKMLPSCCNEKFMKHAYRVVCYRTETWSLSLSAIFSRWTWVSRHHNVSILDFVGAKDDGGGGDNWSYKSCKAPVKSSPPTNQHLVFYRPMLFLSPNQQSQSTEGINDKRTTTGIALGRNKND